MDVSPEAVVAAGSINVGGGTLRVRASAGGTDNSLTQIVTLVEQAQAKKGVRARLADRIARPLVPLVLIAAALVAGYGFIVGDPLTWIERALVVLVAASPCALAIAVLVTVISAIGAASKLGVVIKSGEAFEQLGTIRTIAFDKTGTLTRNQPSVIEARTFGQVDNAEMITRAAAAESTMLLLCVKAVRCGVGHGWFRRLGLLQSEKWPWMDNVLLGVEISNPKQPLKLPILLRLPPMLGALFYITLLKVLEHH
ncbi:HAD-IC family P-type ATPase [Scrofimicrobium canadense]|uniref:HAD-IC family P-type ATPase n=1 Tax=Scrofimicrobium canadense TaxID=2652290 RepID=UPI00298D9725|nr:HAD-IC family P-type ATPase [Scrofimicrobium canadense]